MQSCLALRLLVKRENDGARGRLMNFFFLSNIGPRLACTRTSRKTSARLKITFVDMTYPKGWTGSLLLCPLIFSWFFLIHFQVVAGLTSRKHSACWMLLWRADLGPTNNLFSRSCTGRTHRTPNQPISRMRHSDNFYSSSKGKAGQWSQN